MPFSTGLPYRGKYRYFIDPVDPSVAILQEFAEPQPAEFKTISGVKRLNQHSLTLNIGNCFHIVI